MADECCRCTQWNSRTKVCGEPLSIFHNKKTSCDTACDLIEKGEPNEGYAFSCDDCPLAYEESGCEGMKCIAKEEAN